MLIFAVEHFYSQHIPADVKPSIADVANESKSYALPVSVLTGMLKAHVEWENRKAEQEGKEEAPVITYECRDFDYDTFGVVERVLNRSYVSEKAIHDASACLDFFGPFKYENIFVSLALESKGDSVQENPTKKARKTEDASSSAQDEIDTDLIICESEARMRAVANVAKQLNEPYIPFKLLFVEGVLEAVIEYNHPYHTAVEIPMLPAACLLGDHDNVFFLRSVCSRFSVKHSSFQDIHNNSNVWKLYPEPVVNAILSGAKSGSEVDFRDRDVDWGEVERYDVTNQLDETGWGFDLKVGLRETDIKSAIAGCCINHPPRLCDRPKMVYLPGLDQEENADDGTSLFHYNDQGEVAFTEKEAERASDFVASFGLEERVKSSLQKKRFVLPQTTNTVNTHFCNESVYGNVNILWVTGVIRMENTRGETESNAPAAPTEDTFDVWPSQQANAASENTRARIIVENDQRETGELDYW